MAELDSVVLAVKVCLEVSGELVVVIAVIEFIILSIIETGFSVVASFTFGKETGYLACKNDSVVVVTKKTGLFRAFSVEEEMYSSLIRFADGTVFTGSSNDIISSPKSASFDPDPEFTCKVFRTAYNFSCIG